MICLLYKYKHKFTMKQSIYRPLLPHSHRQFIREIMKIRMQVFRHYEMPGNSDAGYLKPSISSRRKIEGLTLQTFCSILIMQGYRAFVKMRSKKILKRHRNSQHYEQLPDPMWGRLNAQNCRRAVNNYLGSVPCVIIGVVAR